MSETQETAGKAGKKEVIYTKVAMEDGREVQFAGDRKVQKTPVDGGVRFDLRNGVTRTLLLSEVPADTLTQLAIHGASQKIGDDFAGVKELDDIALSVDEMMDRLRKGEWGVAREAGDSMAGASLVIRAIVEATGKEVAFVKDFLQRKLDTAKAKGEKLSRQALYNSFRAPGSATAVIIDRLEKERLAKSSAVDASALLGEIGKGSVE